MTYHNNIVVADGISSTAPGSSEGEESSPSNNNDDSTAIIETLQIPIPLYAVLLALSLLIFTVTLVYRCPYFGPTSPFYKESNFPIPIYKGSFCISYSVLWLLLVVACCGDATLVTITKEATKKNKNKNKKKKRTATTSVVERERRKRIRGECAVVQVWSE